MSGARLLVGGTAAALAVTVGVFNGGALLAGLAATVGPTPPSALAETEIPPSLLAVYEQAAAGQCPRLPWQVLAAVGFAESRHADGRADPATGQVDPPIFGPALNGSNGTQAIADPAFADGWAHAEGPMQFLPSTWRAYGLGGDIHSPRDAILAAANYLHQSGAPADDRHALYAYNPSRLYVDAVLSYAHEMSRDPLAYLIYYSWEASLPATLGG
jgi:Transglycosylase SLT domain